jgi:hypothetical protein
MQKSQDSVDIKEDITSRIIIWSFFPLLIYLTQLNLWYLHTQNPISKIINKLPVIAVLILLIIALTIKIKNSKVNPIALFLLPVIAIYIYLMDKSLVLRVHEDKYKIFTTLSTYIYTLLVMFYMNKSTKSIFERNKKYLNICIVLGVSIYISTFLLVSDNHPYMANALNFMIVVHSLVQVDLGKLVFFDLYSQYGGYSIFFKPIFMFIEPNILNISIIFALINLFCCVGIYFIITKVITNPKIQIASFLTAIYLQYYSFTIWPNEKYFQVYPIRMLWPIVTTLVVFLTLKQNIFKRQIYFAACSVFAVYWNIETGLAVILGLVFLQLVISVKKSQVIKDLAIYIFLVVIFFSIFTIGIQMLSGKTFNPELFTRSLRFYPTEALLLLNKIWVIVMFVYGCVAIIAFKLKSDSYEIKWFLSWLSIGLLMYHLLRTGQHETTLSNVFWPFSICLGIILEYLRNYHSSRLITSSQKSINLFSKKGLPKNKDWSQISLKENLKRLKFRYTDFLLNFFRPSVFLPLLITFVFSLLIVFLFKIQGGTVVANEERIWDLFDKNSTRELYNYTNDSNQSIFIHVSDQVNGFKSPWQRRIEYTKTIKKSELTTDLLILSDYDSILYGYANAQSPVSWANWRHAFYDREFEEVIEKLKTGKIQTVLIDIYPGRNMYPFSIHGKGLDEKILDAVYKYYKLSETIDGGYVYPGLKGTDWYKSRLEVYRIIG